jgi:hypothetical protein
MEFPVNGFKQVKNSGRMHLVFFVQYGKLEVTVHESAFVVSTGGVWQVPSGKFELFPSFRACPFAFIFSPKLLHARSPGRRLAVPHWLPKTEQLFGSNKSSFRQRAVKATKICGLGSRCGISHIHDMASKERLLAVVPQALEARIQTSASEYLASTVPCPSTSIWMGGYG